MGQHLTRIDDTILAPHHPSPAGPLWREALGTFLRQVRTEQRRILTDIAAEAGVSPQYLSEIERGRKEASSEIMAAVSNALGLTILDLTRGVADLLDTAARTPQIAHSVGGIQRASTTAPATTHGRANLRMVS